MAQVSPATVSLVINNKPGVGEQTRKKVLHILEATQYLPPRAISHKSLSFVFLKYKEHGMIVEENQGFIPQSLSTSSTSVHRKIYSLLQKFLINTALSPCYSLKRSAAPTICLFLAPN